MNSTGQWDGELPDELQEPADAAELLQKSIAFLSNCAGDEAIAAASEGDFRLRNLRQCREQLFDRIAGILRGLGPDEVTW